MKTPSIFRSSLSAVIILSLVATAHAAPSASWRFDAAHRDGANFKALVGPSLPAGDAMLLDGALVLDGTSLTVADPHTKAQGILPVQNLTASMWISLDKGLEWGGLMSVVQDNGDFERGWVLGYNQEKFSFALIGANNERMTYIYGKTSFEPGRWYHVAATYDGRTMSLYVNGQLDGQSAVQSGPIKYPDATPFVLGSYRDNNENNLMQGRLREAQLSSDVLSPQQIAAQFQAQAALAQQPPVTVRQKVAPSNKKVLIIGTDGTRPDIMEKANTPNIHALIAASAYTNKAQTGLPTISGPGWSSMLTGVWRDKHGVAGNDFKSNNYAQYPDLLTRLEKINPEFSTFAAADWGPILTTDSNGPLFSNTVDVKLALSTYNDVNDGRIADLSSAYLAKANVDAAFIYFGELDGIAHGVGPLHPRYAQGLERLDKYVGQLLAALRSRPNYANEDWLILMSTDHGHVDKGGHGGPSPEERTIFFLANGPSVDKNNLKEPVGIVDVGVTALAHLGVKAEPAWGFDGKVQALR